MAATQEDMKVLIAGADGQLGRSLQHALRSKGIEFLALSRGNMDICNIFQVRDVAKSFGASDIINSAAYTNVEKAEIEPEKAFSINEMGSRNLAIVSREINARLIHISTDYVFSGTSKEPWKVDSIANPLSVYGKTKLAGEIAIREELSDNYLIIRTAWLYSEFGNNFYKTILKLAKKDLSSINVVNDQIGQPTSANELAYFIVSLLPSDIPAGIFHATNSGSTNRYEFACYLFQLGGANASRINPISSEDYKAIALRPAYSVLDNSKWCEFGIDGLGPWQESVDKAFSCINNSLI